MRLSRDFILRYCRGEGLSRKQPGGHTFWCPCQRFEMPDRVVADLNCLRCKGTGEFRARLNRRQHHVFLVLWGQCDKDVKRSMSEDDIRYEREEKAARIARAFGHAGGDTQ